MVSHIHKIRTVFEELSDGCKKYMKFRRVHEDMKHRVLNYLEFIWLQNQATTVDEKVFRKQLNSNTQRLGNLSLLAE
jgi:hypothetical protein